MLLARDNSSVHWQKLTLDYVWDHMIYLASLANCASRCAVDFQKSIFFCYKKKYFFDLGVSEVFEMVNQTDNGTKTVYTRKRDWHKFGASYGHRSTQSLFWYQIKIRHNTGSYLHLYILCLQFNQSMHQWNKQ